MPGNVSPAEWYFTAASFVHADHPSGSPRPDRRCQVSLDVIPPFGSHRRKETSDTSFSAFSTVPSSSSNSSIRIESDDVALVHSDLEIYRRISIAPNAQARIYTHYPAPSVLPPGSNQQKSSRNTGPTDLSYLEHQCNLCRSEPANAALLSSPGVHPMGDGWTRGPQQITPKRPWLAGKLARPNSGDAPHSGEVHTRLYGPGSGIEHIRRMSSEPDLPLIPSSNAVDVAVARDEMQMPLSQVGAAANGTNATSTNGYGADTRTLKNRSSVPQRIRSLSSPKTKTFGATYQFSESILALNDTRIAANVVAPSLSMQTARANNNGSMTRPVSFGPLVPASTPGCENLIALVKQVSAADRDSALPSSTQTESLFPADYQMNMPSSPFPTAQSTGISVPNPAPETRPSNDVGAMAPGSWRNTISKSGEKWKKRLSLRLDSTKDHIRSVFYPIDEMQWKDLAAATAKHTTASKWHSSSLDGVEQEDEQKEGQQQSSRPSTTRSSTYSHTSQSPSLPSLSESIKLDLDDILDAERRQSIIESLNLSSFSSSSFEFGEMRSTKWKQSESDSIEVATYSHSIVENNDAAPTGLAPPLLSPSSSSGSDSETDESVETPPLEDALLSTGIHPPMKAQPPASSKITGGW